MKHKDNCHYYGEQDSFSPHNKECPPCTCSQQPEEECKCELDGFLGAMTSQNCSIHKGENPIEDTTLCVCQTCDNTVTFFGAICEKCAIPFQAGERSATRRVVNETKQELNEIIRRLESRII